MQSIPCMSSSNWRLLGVILLIFFMPLQTLTVTNHILLFMHNSVSVVCGTLQLYCKFRYCHKMSSVVECIVTKWLKLGSYSFQKMQVRKYHDIFENIENITIFSIAYISDIFDTFDIFKNAPIVRVGLLNKLLNHAKVVKHTVFN